MDLYNPPYESSAAEWFAHHVSKYLDDTVEMHRNVEIPTFCGDFKIGFVLARDDRRIGIEVGGERFLVAFTEEWRDALVLGTGAVDVIYRLTGPRLRERTEDILYVLLQIEPRFFSSRGAINLERLADPDVKERSWRRDKRFFEFHDIVGQEYQTSGIQRHSWEIVPKRHNCFREFYSFATEHPGLELDEIIRMWTNQRRQADVF